MARVSVRVGIGCALALVVLGAVGCGHTADAFGCQLGNHGDEWFGGLSYNQCMRSAQEERADLARQDQDEAACRDGAAPACYRAAAFNDRAHHRDRAQDEYETACQAGIGGGCLGAGVSLLEWGSSQDAARAVVFLRRACDLGVAGACARAAAARPVPADQARLDERACLLGEITSCARAGDAQADVDRTRARRFYEIGCRASNPDACAGLGRLEAGAR